MESIDKKSRAKQFLILGKIHDDKHESKIAKHTGYQQKNQVRGF
jgi:hypothetical protein